MVNTQDKVTIEEYGSYETAWCPGCGNFAILRAVKQALVNSGLRPHQALFVSGIGQAAKTPHYLNCNVFNGLHGRALPVATGAKLTNPDLAVVVESGDGCNYGEGGNHFLNAMRRNIDVTLIVHDNQVYGLTKGQASPTSAEGFVTRAQPGGVMLAPFNPLAVAVAMRAGFVARGFSGMVDHLTELVEQAIAHKGLSLVDVFQPCVSFNRVNTLAWYREHTYQLEDSHDPTDLSKAMDLAVQEDKFPLGIIYKNDRASFHTRFPALAQGSLIGRQVDKAALAQVIRGYA
jgi:2-oxoglutarate ferredoxin oxidoreductase subunit beta